MVDQQADNIKGVVFILIGSAIFTIEALLIKLVGARLHIAQILFVRQFVLIALIAPYLIHQRANPFRTRHPLLHVVRVALALCAMLLGFSAFIYMPLADATAIGFAKSFFVTIFAVVILHETVRKWRWMSVAAGFLGVTIMLRPGTDSFSVFGMMALGGAAFSGLVMVIIRILARTDSPTTIMSWQAIGVTLLTLAPGIWFWQWPTSSEWALLVGAGLASFGVQFTNVIAYRASEASLLASLEYVRLIYAAFFGWLFFATLPSPASWLGACIIVASSILIVCHERRLRALNIATGSVS